MTDAHKFLRSRRSVRRFKPLPVPKSTIQKILTTATYAPSAHNRQPWRFVVLTNGDIKSRLADEMAVGFKRDLKRNNVADNKIQQSIEKSRMRITSSPVIIILCMDASEMDSYPDAERSEAERVMAIQSVANAGMQLLLAAHAEGLGSVWTCSPLFAQNTVRKTLNLLESWEPQGMFFMGYPATPSKTRERKPYQELSIFI